MRPRKNNGGAKVVSGAELRARREARAAATDPKVEAQRRESSLLKSLTTAREDFDWFVSNRAWEPLGFETFTGWWMARVQPIADALMKPVREVARTAMDLMTEEQKALPPAQRLRQRDIAAAVGASQATVSRRTRDADASDVDLDKSAREQVGVSDPRPTDPEEPAPPVGSSTQTAAERPRVDQGTADGVEAAQHPAEDTPAPSGDGEVTSPEGVTPQDSPVADDLPALSRTARTGRDEAGQQQQPGFSHPQLVAGEAPADEVEPSATGAGEMPSDVGEASGDETAGGLQAPGLPAVDSEDEALIASPDELKTLIDEWLDVLDRRVEFAVLAPQYDEDSLLDLELQLDGFPRLAGLMRRWFEEGQS